MKAISATSNLYYGLRPHQYSAFQSAIEHPYGIVTDTCGSGKSYVEFELICNALSTGKKIIVLAAHRLDLISQHISELNEYMRTWHPKLWDTYDMFEISSANRSNFKIESITNRGDIQRALHGYLHEGRPVVITLCYQSLANLYAALEGTSIRIDLMVCDEGHFGMSAEHGRNEAQQLCENRDVRITKYDMIKFCDSFLVFTATPFKQTMVTVHDGIRMDIIHSYSYAEAVKDGIVLPFKAKFYRASRNYSVRSQLGATDSAYNDLKNEFPSTSAKLLVCGTSLEYNQLLFNSLVKKYKKQILEGTLAICKVGSSSIDENMDRIPSCEFVDGARLRDANSNGEVEYRLDRKDDRKNKSKCLQAMHDWIGQKDENGNPVHRDLIVIHCQMLGVGVDIPNLNGVCILGNKESADLYQSIMRPCRVAKFDRCKPVEDRLEDHFVVYVHVDEHDASPIEQFVNRLKDIGGISLLESLTLCSALHGSKQKPIDTSAAQAYLTRIIKLSKVEQSCDAIVFDCAEYEVGLAKLNDLYKKYPEERDYIKSQYTKFNSKFLY